MNRGKLVLLGTRQELITRAFGPADRTNGLYFVHSVNRQALGSCWELGTVLGQLRSPRKANIKCV